MRFKLSTLLIVVTLFAVIFGLGYQVVTLRQQVVQLQSQIQGLELRSRIAFMPQPTLAQRDGNDDNSAPQSPFRLIPNAKK